MIKHRAAKRCSQFGKPSRADWLCCAIRSNSIVPEAASFRKRSVFAQQKLRLPLAPAEAVAEFSLVRCYPLWLTQN
jgi:hypothetical protein